MSFTLVTSSVNSSSGPAVLNSGSLDTTGANLIVVCSVGQDITNTLTDNKSNTYILAKDEESGNDRAECHVWYCINPTVGSGHTWTNASVASFDSYSITAWTGSGTPSFDQVNGAFRQGDGTTLTQQPGSITPTKDGELVLAFWGVDDPADTGGTPFAVDSGMTLRGSVDVIPGGLYGIVSADLVQTTAAAINPTLTRSVAQLTSRWSSAVIVSFSVPSVAGFPLMGQIWM